MKYLQFIFLLPLLFCFSCVHPPEIHIGQTYFNAFHIQPLYANALDRVAAHSSVQVSGVYSFYRFAAHDHPALIRLDANDHLNFVLLADSLAAQPGDYVQISGAPFDTLLPLGFTYSQNVKMLHPQDFTIKKDTHRVLAKAQADYLAHHQKLQQQARQPESKLIWPTEPQWQLFVDEKRSKVIVFFSDADLMYALDMNFVYDLNDFDIEQIYAREWFKGE